MSRLYLDKILEPESLACLKFCARKINLPVLSWVGCNQRAGLPMEHEGNRLAYHMIKSSFIKSSN